MIEIVAGSRVRNRYGVTGVVTAIIRTKGEAMAQVTLDRDTLVRSRSARFYNRPQRTRHVDMRLSELMLDVQGENHEQD